MQALYLDAHSTTPVHPEVYRAMEPYFCTHFGNPSSEHTWGWKAASAISEAKRHIAKLVQCTTNQVFTTSGATESLHWLIMGWAKKYKNGKILTTEAEHKATFGACEWATELGAEVEILKVNPFGQIDPETVSKAIPNDRPTLLTFIHGNNEVGSLNPIKELAALKAKFPNLHVHADAAQSVGKIEILFEDWNLDFLSFSGHKLYAPKGVGALIIKDKMTLPPLYKGGGQQMGMRAGTLNVPAIVGLGRACQWCFDHLETEKQRMSRLRDMAIETLCAIPNVTLNGDPKERLPHNLNFSFDGMTMDKLLVGLPGVAFSSSSACSSGSANLSHVLKSMGLSDQKIRSTVRFGLSHETTEEQVQEITAKILKILQTSTTA